MDDNIVPTDRRYNVIVDCPNKRRGCKRSELLGRLKEHRQVCKFEDVSCNYCNMVFERQNLDEHQNLNPTEDRLLAGCASAMIHCLFCQKRLKRQDLSSHMNRNPSWEDRDKGCRRTPVECKFCEVTFMREELKVHLNLESIGEDQLQGCDKAQILCSFCKESTLERKELRFHFNLCPTKENWEQGCKNAVVHCMFCRNRVTRSQLGEHLNMDPTPDTWLEGCDVAEVRCIYCKGEFKRWQLKVKAKKMDDQLEYKHCRAVVATALIAKEKWYEIGLELNIDKKSLDQFKANHNGSVKECFYEIIRVWLTSNQQKSWKTLVRALRSSKVGLVHEAEDVERSVICEDAILKTTDDCIKEIEATILQVNELIQQANKLKKRYHEVRKQLEPYQNKLSCLKIEIDGLNKEFREQAVLNVAQELTTAGTQVKNSDKEISEVESDIALRKVVKELEEIIKSISKCKTRLDEAVVALTRCNNKTEQHSYDLEREREIQLHCAADKMATAKKWGFGGIAMMVGGTGAAVLSLFTGPAAPIVFGAGVAIASGGLATTVTAAGFWYHFKLDRDKFNEEQKKIEAQYIPLAKKCRETLTHGNTTAKGAQNELQELKDITNDFRNIKKQLEGRK